MMGDVCGARGRLVDFWVVYVMVMHQMLHVFPGRGPCQQEVCAVYHLGRCSADCF